MGQKDPLPCTRFRDWVGVTQADPLLGTQCPVVPKQEPGYVLVHTIYTWVKANAVWLV